MEDVGQSFGYVLYRTTLKGPRTEQAIKAGEVHDRALLYVDGKYTDTWDRRDMKHMGEEPTVFNLKADEEAKLDILVENMGRVNYGPKLRDKKGLRGVRFEIQKACYQFHFGWDMYPLPMDNLEKLCFTPVLEEAFSSPVFLRGKLTLTDTPKDTFLRLDGFKKGFVTVNGFNIGRYFNAEGPQKTLYVPAPFLKVGENEIVVFESDGYETPTVTFCDTPDLG
jgi:beta-galactosidase